MVGWEVWFAVVPGLILFLYGIDNFSREVQRVAGNKFRELIGNMTSTPAKGAFFGALATAVIQSSTATTVIAVGFVNAGVLSFAQSLGVVFGANIGSTVTAQLVALKLTAFGPVFILVGFLLSISGMKYKFIGKTIFYFGLVFFSLALISDAIEPIETEPEVLNLFKTFSNVFIAIAAGFLFTAIVQTSAVTTGIVVLLVGGGFIGLEQGIPLIMGANIGTTVTSLIAARGMDTYAKRTAVSHVLFNVLGVLMFLPFITPFATAITSLGGQPAQQMANAHTIFNVICTLVFLIALKPFVYVVEKVVPSKEKEVLFKTKYIDEKLPEANHEAFNQVSSELKYCLTITKEIFSESRNILVTGKTSRMQKMTKLETLNDFLDDKVSDALLSLSKRNLSKKEAKQVILLVRISNEIEQLGDDGATLGYLREDLNSWARMSPDAEEGLERVFEKFDENMGIIQTSVPIVHPQGRKAFRKNDAQLRKMINWNYEQHLKRLAQKKAPTGSVFVEALSTIESANARVREIRKLSEMYESIIKP